MTLNENYFKQQELKAIQENNMSLLQFILNLVVKGVLK